MRESREWTWTGKPVLLFSIAFLSSCAWGNQPSAPPSPVAQQEQSTDSSDTPPAVSSPRPLFLDFPDIPIPAELGLRSKDSYVFQLGSLKTGVLTLRGRVDINSAINFFQMAMPRENWKPRGGFRYKRSVLIFEKPDKTCVINLYEKLFYTYVEIYVAPAAGQIQSMIREDHIQGKFMLAGKTILLGISGGIAAYRAAELTRLLTIQNINVAPDP